MARKWWASDTLHALSKQLADWWPTDTAVDWEIGDARHARRRSDHNPDPSSTPPGVVRAIDIRIRDDIEHPDQDDLDALFRTAERLRLGEDPRINYVIHHRRIFSSYIHEGTPAWTWRPYSHAKPMPHLTHVHVSVLPAGDHNPAPVRVGGPPPVREPEPPPSADLVLAKVLTHRVYSGWPKGLIKLVQRLVGLAGADVDGIVGPVTRRAVNGWVNAPRAR